MKSTLLSASIAIAMLAFTGIASAQEAISISFGSILGNWNAPACIAAGKVTNWNHEFLIEKDSLVLRRKDSDSKGETWTYTVDPSKTPKQLTMIKLGTPDHETGEPQKINAIFEQREQEIRIAFLPGRNGSSLEDRPTDFTSSETNKAIVFVLTPQR